MRIFGIKISLIFICINFFSYYLFGQFTSCPCNKTTCGDVIASFKIDGDLTRICDGSEFTVINNTTTPGIDYYIWDWGDGSRDSVLTNANIKHKYQIPANQVCLDKESLYVICLRAVKKCSSGISCHSNSSPVSVIHRPFADFSLSNLELCVGQKFSFTNKSCNVDESLLDAYLWEFSDGTTATDKSPNKSLSNPGKYDISLKVKNQCGEHRVTKTVNVVDYPNIIVDVSNNAKDTVVCLGEIVSFVNRSNQWSNINWILPTNNYFRDTSNWKILYKYRVKDLQTVGKQDSVPFLDSIVFQVLKSGVYRFEMRSMNVCSTLVWRLNLKVEDGPIYQINKPSVYCETAIYTPIINLTSGSIKSVE